MDNSFYADYLVGGETVIETEALVKDRYVYLDNKRQSRRIMTIHSVVPNTYSACVYCPDRLRVEVSNGYITRIVGIG